jgi:hypothetical protein
MTWASFGTKARQMEGQLPAVKRSVLGGTAAAEALNKIQGRIAGLRIDLDSLRRVGIKDLRMKGSDRGLDGLGKALDEVRECLETLSPMLEDATQQKQAGRRRTRRQLRDLASERTQTANAITNLEDSLATVLADLNTRGIQAYRTRQRGVRAIVTDREPPDHRELA